MQPHTYPDEYIDFWAVIFIASKYRSSGITFEFFLLDPWSWIDAWQLRHEMLLDEGYRPLMIDQQLVQRLILLDELANDESEITAAHGHPVEMHGPRLIESLRNTVNPKFWKTRTRRAAQ
jgi:hypothetical protein